MSNNIKAILLASLILFSFSAHSDLAAGVWETELILPGYDPLWETIGRLRKDFREIKALDEMISTAEKIKTKYPDKPEPYLWLAWSLNQKALRCDCERDEQRRLNMRAIENARKSYLIKRSRAAFRIFSTSASAYHNFKEIKKEHGQWIKECAPLPYGRVLPELTRYPEWEKAVKLWDRRTDIGKAREALRIFEKLAEKNPGDYLAQLWASRAAYYLGSYYITKGQEGRADYFFEKGADYGERAVNLEPLDLPANYWYFLNFVRALERANIFTQLANSRKLLKYIVFCFRENMTYFYFGPAMVAGGAIARGGWVTRNILEMMGYSLEDLMTVLDLAAVLYPTYFRIQSCRAEMYYNTGRAGEAKKILTALLKRDPEENKIHTPENRVVLMVAANLLKKIEAEDKK